jgi:hypothetical protein
MVSVVCHVVPHDIGVVLLQATSGTSQWCSDCQLSWNLARNFKSAITLFLLHGKHPKASYERHIWRKPASVPA